jgi:hypothetical protein
MHLGVRAAPISATIDSMSDPRDVAHDKKVSQEKKHHGEAAGPAGAPAAQPGKKTATAAKRSDPASVAAATGAADEAGDTAAPADVPAPVAPAAREASLAVLSKLKELEFHSRTSVERLAELTLTVGDELKQQAFVAPLDDLYSAQSAVQTKLTSLVEAYTAEVGRES